MKRQFYLTIIGEGFDLSETPVVMGFSYFASMKKIVIVVGAGANRELDLPTGYELIHRIISEIGYNPTYQFKKTGQFQDPVNQFFQVIGRKTDTMQEEAENDLLFKQHLLPFREALSAWAATHQSLDAFLNQGNINEIGRQFGKFAIAYYILGQEEWLMRENLYALHDNWIRSFIEKYLQPIKDALRDGPCTITIITFNYDRIIEHFLYLFLRHTPGPVYSGEESRAIVERFGIVHVYNNLADLEWQQPGGKSIRFGERNNDKGALTQASGAIQLIGEQGIGRVTESTKIKIRELVRTAEQCYFLGFGCDPANMEILFGQEVSKKASIQAPNATRPRSLGIPTWSVPILLSPSTL